MSLLLDALQRASKEKEKLAESRASGPVSEPASTLAPTSPVSYPDLSLEPLQLATPPTDSTSPALSLAIESAPLKGDTPAGADSDVSMDRPQEMAAEFRLESSVNATASHTSEHIDVQPKITAADTSKVEAQSPTANSAATNSAEPASTESPIAVPNIQTEKANRIGSATVADTATADAVGKKAPPQPGAASNQPSSQIAREILAAKARPARKLNPRLIGLAMVLVVIAAINAAFFLGFFDSLLGKSNSVPGTAVAVAPAPPASSPPQVVESNVAAQPIPVEVQPKEAADMSVASQSNAQTKAMGGPRAETATRAREFEASDVAKAPKRSASSTKPIVVARKEVLNPLDRAYAALTEGQFDEAGAAYRLALEKNSGERDALLGLAYIAHRQGNLDEARARYQQVLRLDPAQADAIAGLLGLATDGDLVGAASRIRDMAERSPESAVSLASLGGILVREGRIAEAQQVYFKAVAIEPDNALYAFNLAVALDRLHKYSQAQSYYQRALALVERASPAESNGFPREQALRRIEQLRAVGNAEASPVASDSRRK
jgi:tetratricopeptide (TPR) repeat protein